MAKIDDCLKILTDDEVQDFVAINLSEYLKYTREKLYPKLSGEQNLRKAAELFYIFLTTRDKEVKYVKIMRSSSSDNCMHRHNMEDFNISDPEI